MTSYPPEIGVAGDGINMGKAATELSSFRLAHLISLRIFINEAGDQSTNGGPLNIVTPEGDSDPNVLYTAISRGAKD